MTDRTVEFRQYVAGLSQASAPGAKKGHDIPSSRSEFHNTTADIAAGIQRTTATLGELTRLVRQQGLFDDPTEQINSLIVRIKSDIGDLNSKCDSAQQFVEHSKRQRGTNTQTSSHNTGVVTSLKSELLQATQGFKSALEMRSSKMKNQQERRVMLTGSGALSPMRQFRATAIGPGAGVPGDSAQLTLPAQPDASNALTKMSSPYNASATPTRTPLHGNSSREEAGVGLNHQQQQLLIQPPSQQQYYEQRQEAVSEVERSIGEVGQLFKRLSTMIAEQSELVERIDDDIESAVYNSDRAQDALLKAYETVSSNRGMYTKISAILLIFIIFFVIFLM